MQSICTQSLPNRQDRLCLYWGKHCIAIKSISIAGLQCPLKVNDAKPKLQDRYHYLMLSINCYCAVPNFAEFQNKEWPQIFFGKLTWKITHQLFAIAKLNVPCKAQTSTSQKACFKSLEIILLNVFVHHGPSDCTSHLGHTCSPMFTPHCLSRDFSAFLLTHKSCYLTKVPRFIATRVMFTHCRTKQIQLYSYG